MVWMWFLQAVMLLMVGAIAGGAAVVLFQKWESGRDADRAEGDAEGERVHAGEGDQANRRTGEQVEGGKVVFPVRCCRCFKSEAMADAFKLPDGCFLCAVCARAYRAGPHFAALPAWTKRRVDMSMPCCGGAYSVSIRSGEGFLCGHCGASLPSAGGAGAPPTAPASQTLTDRDGMEAVVAPAPTCTCGRNYVDDDEHAPGCGVYAKGGQVK